MLLSRRVSVRVGIIFSVRLVSGLHTSCTTIYFPFISSNESTEKLEKESKNKQKQRSSASNFDISYTNVLSFTVFNSSTLVKLYFSVTKFSYVHLSLFNKYLANGIFI